MSERTCSIEGCERGGKITRGWCRKHYMRWYVHGDPLVTERIVGDDQARFLSKVDRRGDDECWPWLGPVNEVNGYGYFRVGPEATPVSAHRYAYELMVGPIPEGLVIDHVRGNGCTRRDCVNWVSHLEAVTQRENVLRGDAPPAVNARKTHCPQGHEYTPENTKVRRQGWRECKTCIRDRRLEAANA